MQNREAESLLTKAADGQLASGGRKKVAEIQGSAAISS